ncbi:MAG: 1,4-dihydroxy-2-naphthoate polyprenyltransferase [Myxococcota bacterium]|nr:1,4-dihydroxy-2-naphthoate polyprenyltransferase [Myxococcota bacterium]
MASVASAPAAPAPTGWRVWWLAARPRTLPVALAPVAVGTAVAASLGAARAGPALAAALGALLITIGTNLANDVFDAEQGADGADRIGPPRAVQMGWLSPAAVRLAMAAVFAAATAVGVYLVALGGWPVVWIGLLSIAAGIAYTGGPWPLGYHGLGDLTVLVFFGGVAVAGTVWVQALALPPVTWAAALPVGALATAVLVVNNLRDVDSDRRAGKRTLAVRLGRRAARLEYAALLAAAYAVPLALWLATPRPAWVLLPLLSLPLAAPLLRCVATRRDGPALNEALAGTARLELVFALLLAAGLQG